MAAERIHRASGVGKLIESAWADDTAADERAALGEILERTELIQDFAKRLQNLEIVATAAEGTT
jgi:hypothetical protein